MALAGVTSLIKFGGEREMKKEKQVEMCGVCDLLTIDMCEEMDD